MFSIKRKTCKGLEACSIFSWHANRNWTSIFYQKKTQKKIHGTRKWSYSVILNFTGRSDREEGKVIKGSSTKGATGRAGNLPQAMGLFNVIQVCEVAMYECSHLYLANIVKFFLILFSTYLVPQTRLPRMSYKHLVSCNWRLIDLISIFSFTLIELSVVSHLVVARSPSSSPSNNSPNFFIVAIASSIVSPNFGIKTFELRLHQNWLKQLIKRTWLIPRQNPNLNVFFSLVAQCVPLSCHLARGIDLKNFPRWTRLPLWSLPRWFNLAPTSDRLKLSSQNVSVLMPDSHTVLNCHVVSTQF